MAQASGGRKKRSRKNDRRSATRRNVRTTRTATTRHELHEPATPERRPEPRRRSESEAENLLFFTKLRKRAKWIFVLLALAFGIGFVGFGVGGSGGGGVGDIIGDVLGREGDATPSISQAQNNVNDNPSDPDAHFDLARAYQADQRLEEAAASYEQVIVLRPDDSSALRSLASLYQQDTEQARVQAEAIEQRAAEASPVNAALFDPQATGLELALGEDQLGLALAEGLSNSADVFYVEVEVRAVRWLDALQRLAVLEPASQTVQLEIGQAAAFAGDFDAATQAYLRALEIDPVGPRAPIIRTSLRQFGFLVPGDAQADVDAILEAQQGASGGAIFEQVGEGEGAEVEVGPDGSIGEQQPLDDSGG